MSLYNYIIASASAAWPLLACVACVLCVYWLHQRREHITLWLQSAWQLLLTVYALLWHALSWGLQKCKTDMRYKQNSGEMGLAINQREAKTQPARPACYYETLKEDATNDKPKRMARAERLPHRQRVRNNKQPAFSAGSSSQYSQPYKIQQFCGEWELYYEEWAGFHEMPEQEKASIRYEHSIAIDEQGLDCDSAERAAFVATQCDREVQAQLQRNTDGDSAYYGGLANFMQKQYMIVDLQGNEVSSIENQCAYSVSHGEVHPLKQQWIPIMVRRAAADGPAFMGLIVDTKARRCYQYNHLQKTHPLTTEEWQRITQMIGNNLDEYCCITCPSAIQYSNDYMVASKQAKKKTLLEQGVNYTDALNDEQMLQNCFRASAHFILRSMECIFSQLEFEQPPAVDGTEQAGIQDRNQDSAEAEYSRHQALQARLSVLIPSQMQTCFDHASPIETSSNTSSHKHVKSKNVHFCEQVECIPMQPRSFS